MLRPLLPLLLLASPATAEFRIEEGTYFRYVDNYDHKTDSFTGTPEKGTEEACFQITGVDLAGEKIHFVHVSGTYHPWWSDTPLPQGFEDTYVPPIAFLDNRPAAKWTDLITTLLITLPDCETSS